MEMTEEELSALSEALRTHDGLVRSGYVPGDENNHFSAFTHFAHSALGDSLRKVGHHLFGKLLGAEGHTLVSEGHSAILDPEEGGTRQCRLFEKSEHVFTVAVHHSPAKTDRVTGRRTTARNTLAIKRAGDDRAFIVGDLIMPENGTRSWRYRVHDLPDAVPALVETCAILRRFIGDECANDTTFSATCDWPEFMRLVELDGGLPGRLTDAFAAEVLRSRMIPVSGWMARHITHLDEVLGGAMTWPTGCVNHNDLDRYAVLVRAGTDIALVDLPIHLHDGDFASFSVVRRDASGTPVAVGNMLVPVGLGQLSEAIDNFTRGGEAGAFPGMAVDLASGVLSTTAGYLERRLYLEVPRWIDTLVHELEDPDADMFRRGTAVVRELDGALKDAPGQTVPVIAP